MIVISSRIDDDDLSVCLSVGCFDLFLLSFYSLLGARASNNHDRCRLLLDRICLDFSVSHAQTIMTRFEWTV